MPGSIQMFKVPLILTSAVVSHFAATNPNPAPENSEAKKYAASDVSRKLVNWVPASMKVVYWACILAETAGVLCTNYPAHPISRQVLSFFPAANRTSFDLSPEYIIGALFVISGGLIRCSAFRALGSMFTFHLTIRDKHTLVTTGPYAWVRHPAYAGMLAFCIGASIMTLSRGSLVAGTGLIDTKFGRAAAYGVVALLGIINWTFSRRLAAEDQVLQNHFGAQWNEWAKRVPYRLCPWIY